MLLTISVNNKCCAALLSIEHSLTFYRGTVKNVLAMYIESAATVERKECELIATSQYGIPLYWFPYSSNSFLTSEKSTGGLTV